MRNELHYASTTFVFLVMACFQVVVSGMKVANGLFECLVLVPSYYLWPVVDRQTDDAELRVVGAEAAERARFLDQTCHVHYDIAYFHRLLTVLNNRLLFDLLHGRHARPRAVAVGAGNHLLVRWVHSRLLPFFPRCLVRLPPSHSVSPQNVEFGGRSEHERRARGGDHELRPLDRLSPQQRRDQRAPESAGVHRVHSNDRLVSSSAPLLYGLSSLPSRAIKQMPENLPPSTSILVVVFTFLGDLFPVLLTRSLIK